MRFGSVLPGRVCVLHNNNNIGWHREKEKEIFPCEILVWVGPPAASDSFSFLKKFKQKMRVRTITGTTYYMRSGGRVTGEVHERFMLIDGIKVATGSYR